MSKRWVVSLFVLAAACGSDSSNTPTDMGQTDMQPDAQVDMGDDMQARFDCANPLVNVAASDWVQSQTDIRSYDVRVDPKQPGVCVRGRT